MKILQLCYKMPYPLKGGGEHSIYNSAQSLLIQPNTDVKVLAMNTKKAWVNHLLIPKDFLLKTNFEFIETDTRIKPLQMFLNLFTTKSYLVCRFYSDSYRDKLIALLKSDSYDILQLEHLYLGIYYKDIREHYSEKIVLRSQNVEYKLWEKYIENEKNTLVKIYLKIALKRLKKFEIALLGKMDGIINLSKDDQKIYQSHHPNTPTTSIPVGFDQSTLSDYNYERQFEEKEVVVYHLGAMDWLPNVQGVTWFIEKVLPILSDIGSEIKVRFAGKKMPKKFHQYKSPNLYIDGEIEDGIEYQEDKSILIVPLLAGSGIRVKIIEALTLGKSIVSTTLGAQGIDYTEGENILIADDPRSFAEAIVKCANSLELRKKLTSNAKKLASSTYSLEQVGVKKIEFYNRLKSNS